MPIEPGATYLFDLGYYDYDWWAKLDRAQCRIVTRFKSNTPLAVVEELPVPPGTAILSNRVDHPLQSQPDGSGRRSRFTAEKMTSLENSPRVGGRGTSR